MERDLMPAVFVGHGNPMNALEPNRWTEAWKAFGASIPRPRAILAVSAHWYVNASVLTAQAQPPTIHDFYGFPEELFAVQYPAPGDPALAQEIVDLVAPTWVGLDRDSWGIDHGTWSVLVHLWPEADVPVVQLSVHAAETVEHHLGRIEWGNPDGGADWARRFDEAARGVMLDDPASIGSLVDHPDYAAAV